MRAIEIPIGANQPFCDDFFGFSLFRFSLFTLFCLSFNDKSREHMNRISGLITSDNNECCPSGRVAPLSASLTGK